MAPPRKKLRTTAEQSADADALTAQVEDIAPGDAQPASKEKARKTLFIRSLPPSTTTDSLTTLFSRSHPVRHATAVLDPGTNTCKGYGFVTFADAEDAEAARTEFHGFELNGELGEDDAAPNKSTKEGEEGKIKKRRLRVEIAEPRKRGGAKDAEGDEAQTGETHASAGRRGTVKEEDRLKRDLETGSKIIVRNLPWTIKSGEQLATYFEKWGKLKGAVVPRKNGGLLQGFGFVTFKSRKAAERAIKEGNGLEVEGRQVAIDWAVQREVWRGTQDEDPSASKYGATEEEEGDQDENMAEIADAEERAGSSASDNESEADEADDTDASTAPSIGSGKDEEDGKDDEDDNENEDRSGTLFIRNLPFTCTDEDLEDVFRPFGAVRYARVVLDPVTERSRGTGFVCFYSADDAENCLRSAPRQTAPKPSTDKSQPTTVSLLQDENLDPSGKYTLDGRVLSVARAVAKTEASRLREHGVAQRMNRDKDKRRLYLLNEGTIRSNSKLWAKLSPSEQQMREASAKQRRTIIESNPSLQISLTRLSIRNVPRSVTSKDLKDLARKAVVGFATDVKEGKRERLSKEEIMRGGEEMKDAEKDRRDRKKGLVKQAKVVFEGQEGGKVEEKSGAGRSRGYGFVEYYTHRNALMGLRWLNGHQVDYKAMQKIKEKGKDARTEMEDRKKRLIVEFAIENRQVVQRRRDREGKARERGQKGDEEGGKIVGKGPAKRKAGKDGKKRKRDAEDDDKVADDEPMTDAKLAKRQRIIQKKRMMRRAKKQGREWKP